MGVNLLIYFLGMLVGGILTLVDPFGFAWWIIALSASAIYSTIVCFKKGAA